MEFSDFTIRLIIILIPGAIASLIVEAITIHKKWIPLRFFISAIILGVICFSFLQLLYWIPQLFFSCARGSTTFENLETWKSILQKDNQINSLEIILCIPVSIIVGFVVSSIIQKKIIFKIARWLDVSSKFGDDSLYYHYLNTNEIDWVYVRDKINGLTYRGQVKAFSEDDLNKEILLRNVTVYQYETSLELYQLNEIYLKFNDRDVAIELPLTIT